MCFVGRRACWESTGQLFGLHKFPSRPTIASLVAFLLRLHLGKMGLLGQDLHLFEAGLLKILSGFILCSRFFSFSLLKSPQINSIKFLKSSGQCSAGKRLGHVRRTSRWPWALQVWKWNAFCYSGKQIWNYHDDFCGGARRLLPTALNKGLPRSTTFRSFRNNNAMASSM